MYIAVRSFFAASDFLSCSKSDDIVRILAKTLANPWICTL